MIDPLRRAVQVAGEQVAVRCGALAVTYDETWDRCRRLVGLLRDLGLERGDRVGVAGPNCHRYLELYQAIPAAGMVFVPLDHRHPAAALRSALQDAGAEALFAGPGIDVPHGAVPHLVDLDERYDAALAAVPPADLPDDLAADDLAALFHTGGTTGAAKGVMLTHRNLIANALHLQAGWSFGPGTRWLIVAPLFHAAGSIAVLATVWHGGEQIVLEAFAPGEALDLIERHGVTDTLVVPTMLAALADEQLAHPRDVHTLRAIAHGGAPVATETLRRAHAAFPDAALTHVYGATETAPIATLLAHEEAVLDAPHARSCGQPAVGVEVAVVDRHGAPAGRGEVGEVLIRGENVMAGYWNEPARTAAAVAGGWYRTGDLGFLDDRAFLYVVDRAQDVIVSGGEHVYSTEVEDVLYRHPAVLEAAVFGVPDERRGEAVHAVVVLREPVGEPELLEHCRVAIAGHKVPERVELRRDPLPKSGAGTILKRELRAPYWEPRSDR